MKTALTSVRGRNNKAAYLLTAELRKAGLSCEYRDGTTYIPSCNKTVTPVLDYSLASLYSSKAGLVQHLLSTLCKE